MAEWLKHDGGEKPVPDNTPVDLQWGFGVILGRNSDEVNWLIPWVYRPSDKEGGESAHERAENFCMKHGGHA